MVEKTEGCNAIACRCGIQFCFVCAKQIQPAGKKMTAKFCQCADPLVMSHRGAPVITPAQRAQQEAAAQAQAAQMRAMLAGGRGGGGGGAAGFGLPWMAGMPGMGHAVGGGPGGAGAAAAMQAQLQAMAAQRQQMQAQLQAALQARMANIHRDLMGFGGAPEPRGRGGGRRARRGGRRR
jgi:hypothetical protein